jgi:transposase-like protein
MTDGKRTRKRHTPQQKAKIVLEILREERTLAQIAAEYGIHPNQLRKWKAQAVERLPAVFDSDSAAAKERLAEKEAELESLYTQIGRLTTQVNWLKKKGGFDLDEG